MPRAPIGFGYNPVMPWLLDSTAGLFTRLALGSVVFSILAIVDLRKNGRSARRWREYVFLVACVFLALLYGAVNDQLTVGISWEYFYYGKDLMSQLGPQIPPASLPLRIAAAEVGLKATWSAGLLLGVILLFANNPSTALKPLPHRRLFARIPLLFSVTVISAILFGALGHLGLLTRCNADFPLLVKDDLWRPHRFMTVYGIHLGGYIGGLAGTILAVFSIRNERKHGPTRADANAVHSINPEVAQPK